MTPREFSYALDGARIREERAWMRLSTQIAFLGWQKERRPKAIYDLLMGKGDDGGFDSLVGRTPEETESALAAFEAKGRKLRGS